MYSYVEITQRIKRRGRDITSEFNRSDFEYIEYDRTELQNRIKEKLGKGSTRKGGQTRLAELMGISKSLLNQKIKNVTPFKEVEISMICKILDIAPKYIGKYFFAIKS